MPLARTPALAALGLALCAWAMAQAPQPRERSVALWTEGITDVSGLSALSPFSRIPYNDQDLRTICAMKQTVLADAKQATGDYLAHLLSEPASRQDTDAIMKLHHQSAQIASYEGNMAQAIEQFEAALLLARGRKLAYFEHSLEEKLGIAQLRRGEIENCVHNHHARSCIFPISRDARHRLTSGSQQAIGYFTKLLEREPDNLPMRWLLNIAHMTLGEYRAKVPAAHLIPPSAFESGRQLGLFADVASEAGLDVRNMAGGTIVEDFDGDGLLDIVISSQNSCESLRYFRNEGNGKFRDRTAEAKLSDQLGGLNLVSTDYNNDGHIDIFVLRGGWEFPMRNSLLRNNRDGTFTDVTAQSGLASPATATQTAAWADFDLDGHLDVFVGNEFSPSQLFRNQGDGTFIDVAGKAGVGRAAFTKGTVWGDYDNDGYPDLYVSNFGEPNFLYRNNGDGTFTEVAGKLGVNKPSQSFPAWFMDYDNDGWEDLFVSGYAQSLADVARGYLGQALKGETFKVYRNLGNGAFADVTSQVGMARNALTMGCNFGDLDNDGWLDFYLGTGAPSYGALVPNLLFWNDGGRAFVDVTSSSGTGHLQKGHGIAFADLDRDGDQDIFLHSGGAVPGDAYANSLFRNPGHGNRWISLRLAGNMTNRAALGARIKVVLPGGREIHRTVSGGTSFGGSSFEQHIGLGKAARIETLEVFWPVSRKRQVFRNIDSSQRLLISESSSELQRIEQKAFALGAPRR